VRAFLFVFHESVTDSALNFSHCVRIITMDSITIFLCSMKTLCSYVILIVFIILSLGCEDSHYLDQVDRAALFAEPTPAEISQLRFEWTNKDLSVKSYHLDQLAEIGETGVTLKVISYSTQGMKQFAALIIPESEEEVPLRIFVNGFDLSNTTNSIKLLIDESFNDQPYAFALPSLRGQSVSIEVNSIVYKTPIADGNRCDAFDGAADDVIAMMNAIQLTESRIDMQRTSVRGGSRGGTVAMLVGQRDSRVKGVVAVAAPTDMLELTSQNEDDATYQCQFLKDLVENSVLLDDARKKILKSSPVFFADTSPRTQLHLAEDDRIVPVSQGYIFKQRMTDLNLEESIEFFIYPGRDHSNITTDNSELNQRIEAFLNDL
jgi:dienelactone hydrolase